MVTERIRLPADDEEVPYEGVPPHLQGPLAQWTADALSELSRMRGSQWVDLLATELRVETAGFISTADAIEDWCGGDADFQLQAIEAILRRADSRTEFKMAVLVAHLALGGSAWQVRDTRPFGLERHVPMAAKQQYLEARATNDSAAEHLAAAWRHCYALNPDPDAAYDQAIKAVESITKPLVVPDHGSRTLGDVLRRLERDAPQWEVVFRDQWQDGISAVLAAIRMLWKGHEGRHGGGRVEQIDWARAGVQTAIWIVVMFRDKSIRRLGEPAD